METSYLRVNLKVYKEFANKSEKEIVDAIVANENSNRTDLLAILFDAFSPSEESVCKVIDEFGSDIVDYVNCGFLENQEEQVAKSLTQKSVDKLYELFEKDSTERDRLKEILKKWNVNCNQTAKYRKVATDVVAEIKDCIENGTVKKIAAKKEVREQAFRDLVTRDNFYQIKNLLIENLSQTSVIDILKNL